MSYAAPANDCAIWLPEVLVSRDDISADAGKIPGAPLSDSRQTHGILFRVGARLCVLPLSCVVETMRPQPVDAVAGAPAFVRGLAVIRGAPIPVVDARLLLGEGPDGHQQAPGARFVTLKVGTRSVALAVDAVIGVRALAALTDDPRLPLQPLPPLLAEADSPAIAIGALDRELLMVLREARLLPATAWAALEQQRPS